MCLHGNFYINSSLAKSFIHIEHVFVDDPILYFFIDTY